MASKMMMITRWFLLLDKQDSYNFQAQKHKDSLEGAYDHSKEYDPFKVNKRAIEEQC